MKKIYLSSPEGYVVFLLLLLYGRQLQAQCANADFGTGTFAGWTGSYCLSDSNGYCNYPNPTEFSGLNQGPLNNPPGDPLRQYSHVMCSVAGGNDPNLLAYGVVLPVVKPGATYSARMGNMWQKVRNNTNGDGETLSYSFLVTPGYSNFIYNYAVVLNDGGHGVNQQPYFNIKVTDGNGADISCGDLEVDATTARSIGSFDSIDSASIRFRRWTPVLLPLAAYIGQTVTITFTTRGCAPSHVTYNCAGSHYAYAYISAECGPPAIISSSPAVCGGQPDTLTAPPGAASYLWSGPGVTAPVNMQSVVITRAGRYTVQMTTFGDIPCTFTLDTFISPSHNSPTANFTVTSPVCAGQNATVTYTGSGSQAATFNWGIDNGTATPGTGRGPFQLKWDTAGSRLVTLTVFDSGCLSPPDSLSVTVLPLPAGLTYDTAFCSGDSAVLGPAAMPGYSYMWSPANGLSNPAVSNPVSSLTTTGNNIFTQTYTVLKTDSLGCANTDTAVVTVNPLPIAHFTPPAPGCQTASGITFAPDGTFLPNASFLWGFGTGASPATSNLQNPLVNYSTPVTSAVTLTISQTGSNCRNTFTDSVEITPGPNADFTPDIVTACINLKVCFTNTSTGGNPLGAIWDFGDGSTSTAPNPCHVYSAVGVYPVSLKITTAQGCTDDTTAVNLIHIIAGPTAKFTVSESVVQQPDDEVIFTNQSANSLTYLWTFGTGAASTEVNPTALFPNYGVYNVVLHAYNALGCEDSTTLPITVLPPQNLYIPNAFTPNNDGNNDLFYIEMQEGVTLWSFKVFDRWGEKVHDGLYPWDGTYKGKPCPQAVYVYEAVVSLAADPALSTKRRGSVTLIR